MSDTYNRFSLGVDLWGQSWAEYHKARTRYLPVFGKLDVRRVMDPGHQSF